MNKNTILAFILIMGTIYFFSSSLWYKLTGQPDPREAAKEKTETEQVAEAVDTAERADDKKDSESRDSAVEEKRDEGPASTDSDTDAVSVVDSVKGPGWVGDTVWVDTEKMRVGISEEGGKIFSIRMKKYTYIPNTGTENIELVRNDRLGGGNLLIGGIEYDSVLFQADQTGNIALGEDDSVSLRLTAEKSGGGEVVKTFRFSGDDYIIGMNVSGSALGGEEVTVGWESGIRESEEGERGGGRDDLRKMHYMRGDEVVHITANKPGQVEVKGEDETGYQYYRWAALTAKYFVVGMIVDERSAKLEIAAFSDPAQGGDGRGKKETMNYSFSLTQEVGSSEAGLGYKFYVGPNSISELKKPDVGLHKVMFGGWRWFIRADIWFPAICEFILSLLIGLHGVLRDYGLVIIVLTILSKVVTFPMTQASMKSMGRMKDIQPKVEAIRKRYKGNPQKMNEEVMALYRKEGVNPLNPGCLPMFLQMPVFISLFVVLRKAIELRGEGTFLIPWIKDLSQPEAIPLISPLPFEIPMYGTNVALLPVLMAIVTYFQNKATIKDPNQKAMVYFMPIFMLVLFNSFPSGVVLYWTMSSLIGVVQQKITDRSKKGAEVG